MHTQACKTNSFRASNKPDSKTSHFDVNTSACWCERGYRISNFAFYSLAYTVHACTAVKGLIVS